MRQLVLGVLRVLEIAFSVVALVCSLPAIGLVALRDLMERPR